MHPYFSDPDPSAITAVDHRLGQRWKIVYDTGIWSAERRSADGRERRYIVALSGDELAAKVEAAEL